LGSPELTFGVVICWKGVLDPGRYARRWGGSARQRLFAGSCSNRRVPPQAAIEYYGLFWLGDLRKRFFEPKLRRSTCAFALSGSWSPIC